MKLRLSEIINSKETLINLSTEKFSSKMSYRIQKNIRELNPEWVQFEVSRRLLFEKYGNKEIDKTGKEGYKISTENIDLYNKELNDLLSTQLEINIIQVDISDLTCDISPIDLMKIDWMINAESI